MQLNSHDITDVKGSTAAACRRLIRSGSKSFFAASLLLPRRVRQPALVLYAFCRLADDAVDLGGSPDCMASLRERLERAYSGSPGDSPLDRAFAAVISRHAIPRALPEALLEGFEWDQRGRQYEDFEQLAAYCARVAGSVGAMMACAMNVRAPELVARACDLGVAMQLTNIARDVGEDARRGRLYLPTTWLEAAGLDPQAWLRTPVFCAGLAQVIERILQAADELYSRSEAGIARLPVDCRPGISAARHLYAAIGHEVRRFGCDSVSRRAFVPARRRIVLLGRGLFAGGGCVGAGSSSLAATRFLVEATASRAPAFKPAFSVTLDQRVAWLMDLFARLEERDHRATRPVACARIPD